VEVTAEEAALFCVPEQVSYHGGTLAHLFAAGYVERGFRSDARNRCRTAAATSL
jgi:hypothetical protein